MSKECLGKEVNKTLIERLENYIKSKQVKEEAMSDPSQFFETNFKDAEGKSIFIFADNPGEAPKYYETLWELLTYISFEKEPGENVYEIPGIKMPKADDNSKFESHTIYVTKENAKKISALSNDIKNHLNIVFPDELFQLAQEQMIPGLGYVAPEPRKYSETEEEYEARMEQHYKTNGHDKEKLDEIEYRAPYPHEKVRYTKDNAVMTDEPRESYLETLRKKGLSPEVAEPGAPGMPSGQRRRVVDTNPTLGNRIRNIFTTLNGVKASEKTIKIALGTVAAGALIGGSFLLFPAGSLGMTTVLAVSAPAGVALGLFIKKNKDKWKEGIKEWWKKIFRGPVLDGPDTPEPTQQTPQPQPGANPIPPTGPIVPPVQPQQGNPGAGGTPQGGNVILEEQLMQMFQDIGLDTQSITEIESQIQVIEGHIEMETDETKKAALIEQKRQLIDKERQIYLNMSQIINQFIFNNKSTGGPKL